MEKELEEFIKKKEDADTGKLLLHRERYPHIDMVTAVRCIEARRILRDKIPEWTARTDLLYPDSLPLEQCSSAVTARYKTRFVPEGARIADLTGGLGIDLYYLSEKASSARYCERNAALASIAAHNFPLLGREKIEVHAEETTVRLLESLPADSFDLLYLDPARRGKAGQRVFSVADCEPNLLELKPALFRLAPAVLVKISPMGDLTSLFREIPEIRELHILSVRNECRELLLLLRRPDGTETPSGNGDRKIVVALLPEEKLFIFRPEEEKEAACSLADPDRIRGFLYEPDSALLKSGAFRLTAQRYGLEKISRDTHFYISEEFREDFPGKIRKITEVLPFDRKGQKTLVRKYPECSITARNYPAGAEELKKKLKLKESSRYRMLVTTASDDSRIAVVTEPVTQRSVR